MIPEWGEKVNEAGIFPYTGQKENPLEDNSSDISADI